MSIVKSDYPNKIKANLWADDGYWKFYYRFSKNGRDKRGIIDLSGKSGWNKRDRIRQAESELERIRSRADDGVLDERISVDEFMNRHLSSLPDTPWSKTKRSHYERYINPIIGRKRLVDVRQIHIKDVITDQEKRGLAPRTVKQTLEVLNPAFKEAIANRLIQFNPVDGIKIKRPSSKKMVSNASAELLRIYNAIEKVFGDDPFYYCLYMFALQGRRKSEILNLKWEDIGDGYYILKQTKSGEEQRVYLPEHIARMLPQLRQDTEYVFASRVTGTRITNIEKSTAKLKKELGESFTLHYLRNVIVSAMAESGMEAIYLSGALGHSDPNTITKYLTMNYMKGSEAASKRIEQIISRQLEQG